ncbi:MAG: hypothetical protein ACFFC6_07610 [Promethearchaeota archaeon]
MLIKLLRGLIIAFLSAFIVTFVIFIFSPLLPLNIFEGYLGIIIYLIIVAMSFIVYIFLPPEFIQHNNLYQDTRTVHLDGEEKF